jgi:hypothetical protein
MGVIRSKFSFMGSRKTSVPQPFTLSWGLIVLSFDSGCRQERHLVYQLSAIYVLRANSIGSSTIIEKIDSMRKAGLVSLAFFYCDFREDEKKDLRGLLSSVLVQLCHQSDLYYRIISNFFSEHANGSRHPSDDALVRCLKDILRASGQASVYLIVDGLDECSNTSAMPSPREKVLTFLEDLIHLHLSNLRTCVTSRPEIDIKRVLEPLTSHSISLHDESGQMEDIEKYIRSVVNADPKMRRWMAADRELVIDVLIKKSEGM